MRDLAAQIQRLLRPLKTGLSTLIGRAVMSYARQEGGMLLIQSERLADETADHLESFEGYGLAAWPLPGAEAIVASVGGVRSHGVVIAIADRRYRFELGAQGEVALHDDQGQVVHLKRDGIRIVSEFKVEVEAPEVTVTTNEAIVDADEATITGNLTVDGDLTVAGDVVLGDGAVQFVKLANDTPATKVKAK